ncbi:hypothetical protein NIES3974_16530 [Calothrix sp. NIES-3974]|nr:hypothetical protein NIES3974_16530 [Calothrix sp. NIES-3974]
MLFLEATFRRLAAKISATNSLSILQNPPKLGEDEKIILATGLQIGLNQLNSLNFKDFYFTFPFLGFLEQSQSCSLFALDLGLSPVKLVRFCVCHLHHRA